MKKQALFTMWMIIYQNDLAKNGTMDPDNISDHVAAAEYYPIDTRHCILQIDAMSWLMIQENGNMLQMIEGGGLTVDGAE